VTIVEFGDMQCPFCNRVQPTLDRIRDRYGNDVRIVFKHNPLPFHDRALPAAIALAEAHDQRGDAAFWAMHDLMWQNHGDLDRSHLESYARQVGLSLPRFRRALDRQTHQSVIDTDRQLASDLGATGTPSFFINGRRLTGAQPFQSFADVIDEELAEARQLVQSGTPRSRLYAEIIADGIQDLDAWRAEHGDDSAAGGGQPDQRYTIPAPRDAPRRGSRGAPVTIQLFSDFQCPFCARVRPTVDRILDEYAGQVELVWRDYPLPFHQDADLAAEAAREVYAQGGDQAFWAYHDILFDNSRNLGRQELESYAQRIGGIDMARFRRALDQRRHQADVQADMDAVRDAGARIGTPSFFINGRLLQGAQPFPAFQRIIDDELSGGGP